eukprot:PhM_4_TR15542/c0_g1_i1/m.49943
MACAAATSASSDSSPVTSTSSHHPRHNTPALALDAAAAAAAPCRVSSTADVAALRRTDSGGATLSIPEMATEPSGSCSRRPKATSVPSGNGNGVPRNTLHHTTAALALGISDGNVATPLAYDDCTTRGYMAETAAWRTSSRLSACIDAPEGGPRSSAHSANVRSYCSTVAWIRVMTFVLRPPTFAQNAALSSSDRYWLKSVANARDSQPPATTPSMLLPGAPHVRKAADTHIGRSTPKHSPYRSRRPCSTPTPRWAIARPNDDIVCFAVLMRDCCSSCRDTASMDDAWGTVGRSHIIRSTLLWTSSSVRRWRCRTMSGRWGVYCIGTCWASRGKSSGICCANTNATCRGIGLSSASCSVAPLAPQDATLTPHMYRSWEIHTVSCTCRSSCAR